MGFLDQLKGISTIPENKLHIIMGFPGSGKTTLAATYPKPMLYVQIGDDGGGIVMKNYSDNDIKYLLLENDDKGSVYVKLMSLLDELKASNGAGFKTVVLDAYSSIEEIMVQSASKIKGKALSFDERGQISQAMISLRDVIVSLSKNTPTIFVEITHLKQVDSTDNITGESTIRYIPKMSQGNGNIMLERANNVMYCARKVVTGDDGKPTVKFLTYIGAHPNIDTKFRASAGQNKLWESKGIYIDNCTYDKIKALNENKLDEKVINVIEASKIVDDNNVTNPFEEKKTW